MPQEYFWAWHSDRSNPDASLKATVWLSEPDICLESCEQERIEDAIRVLEELFGDLIEDVDIEEILVEDDGDDLEESEIVES